jgi:hypothetical protein
MMPHEITSLDAAMAVLFHIECRRHGASETIFQYSIRMFRILPSQPEAL